LQEAVNIGGGASVLAYSFLSNFGVEMATVMTTGVLPNPCNNSFANTFLNTPAKVALFQGIFWAMKAVFVFAGYAHWKDLPPESRAVLCIATASIIGDGLLYLTQGILGLVTRYFAFAAPTWIAGALKGAAAFLTAIGIIVGIGMMVVLIIALKDDVSMPKGKDRDLAITFDVLQGIVTGFSIGLLVIFSLAANAAATPGLQWLALILGVVAFIFALARMFGVKDPKADEAKHFAEECSAQHLVAE
jgi:hypothetical protein